MKKLIPLILLFLAANIHAQPDTCHPTFKEIYDFNVGDVFVYNAKSSHSGGGQDMKLKVEIKSKKINGDTTTYIQNIIVLSESFCYTYVFGCKNHIYAYQYTKTVSYIDSANHYLNKCSNDSILVKTESNTCYAKITDNDSSDKRVVFYEYEFPSETFKKGLGRISHSRIIIDGGDSDTLIAYVKNGDSTGTIIEDSTLLKVRSKVWKQDEFILYPNPAHENFTIELPMEYEACQVELISADGSVVLSTRFLNAGQNVISTGNVAPGFYVVRVSAGKDVFYKKLIIN